MQSTHLPAHQTTLLADRQVVAATGRLLKASPGHLEALVLRGRAYFYLSDHDLAKRHFGEALKYDPDYTAARKEFNKVKDLERRRQRAARYGQACAHGAACTRRLVQSDLGVACDRSNLQHLRLQQLDSQTHGLCYTYHSHPQGRAGGGAC